MVRPAVALASLAILASSALLSTAHPLCFYGPDRAVSSTTESTFCPNEQPEGFCCEPLEEALLKTKLAAAAVSPVCSPLYKEVLCGVCNAYSAHIYTRLAALYPREEGKEEQGMAMTREFCSSFFTACKADLGLPVTFCAEHVLAGSKREYWSYPPEISASFSDTGVNPTFPALPEKDLPLEPVDMHITPDGTKWWIAGMAGKIIQVDADDPSDSIDILDISGKLMYAYEQGLLGFAFSPLFSATGVFYVSYSIPGDDIAENGKNVLSKFVLSGAPAATIATEDVLITTSDKSSSAHASGWVGFPPSSYKDGKAAQHELYWSVGDGGPQNDPFGNAQDKTLLHGSIIRILVPSAVGGTGYTIPTGNAFDGTNGEREEVCAWGFRNPFRCSFDLETDDLYCGDVGQDSVEVVNIIKCGYNYGWNTFEGSRCNEGFDGADACPDLDRADYVFPTFEYCHFDYDSSSDIVNLCGDRLVTGLSIIGGYVYRGSKFADVLGGHYIFADHSTGVLHHLKPATGGGWTPGTILAKIPQLASFSEDLDGELYMIEYQGNIFDLPCGSLCSGSDTAATCLPQSDNIPTYESVGCFIDAEDRAMALALDVPSCQTMSAEICSRFCTTVEGATHFGMQYQRECFCSGGDKAYAQYGAAEKGECNMPCSGFPEDTCGGRFRLSVYAITGEGVPATKALVPFTTAGGLPTPISTNYLGCYANVWDPRMSLTTFAKRPSGAMTIGKCREFCLARGESLFALENGYECWCGSSYVQSDMTDARCNAPCSGDPDSRCGGFLYRDIYKVQ